MKNIYIIGFMGVGKSTLGRCYEKKYHGVCVDADDEFARLHDGITTGQYIEKFGLGKFRPEERAVLQSIADNYTRAVVLTGAGLPVYPGNLEIMKADGITIHLNLPLEEIEKRMTAEDLERRPLWRKCTKEQLLALYNQRLPIYNSADFIFDGCKPTEELSDELYRILSEKN